MEKKKIFIILIIAILMLLVIPVPLKLKDGGSTKFVSLLYSVTKIHRLNHQSSIGYEDGWKIEILGVQVYNEVDVYVETMEEQEETNIVDPKANKIDNSEVIQSTNTQLTENAQTLISTPTNNKNQSVENNNSSKPNNNKTSTSATTNNNVQQSTDNNQQSSNVPTENNPQPPQNNDNQPSTNETTNNNQQQIEEDTTKKELEETTRKWFVAQYNVAKQQYIGSLNSSILSKNNEITTLKNEAKACYTEYQLEIQKIKKQCANSGLSGSGTEKQKLKVAEENYKAKASVYTENVKQLESDVAVLQGEISNPNVDNILAIVIQSCNITSKEAHDYYNKYIK